MSTSKRLTSKPLHSDTIRAYYSRVASTYDATFAKVVRPTNERLTEELSVQLGESVLDLCCGTGASALDLATRVGQKGRVVGVDASEEMLAKARARVRNHTGRVELVNQNAIDFIRNAPPSSFDVITLRFALTYFDWHALVPQLPPLLKPGGRLGIVTSTSDSLTQVQTLYRRFVRSPGAAIRLFGHTGRSLGKSWEIFQQLRVHFSRPSFIRVPATLKDVDLVLRTESLRRRVVWHEVRTEMHPSGIDLVQWLVRSGCVAETAVEELSHGAFDFVRHLFADGLEEARVTGGIPLDFHLGGIVWEKHDTAL